MSDVMRLAELIQDEHSRIAKQLSAVVEVSLAMDCTKLTERLDTVDIDVGQEGKYLTESTSALSFQDLVVQRVKSWWPFLKKFSTKPWSFSVFSAFNRMGKHRGGGMVLAGFC